MITKAREGRVWADLVIFSVCYKKKLIFFLGTKLLPLEGESVHKASVLVGWPILALAFRRAIECIVAATASMKFWKLDGTAMTFPLHAISGGIDMGSYILGLLIVERCQGHIRGKVFTLFLDTEKNYTSKESIWILT